MTERLIDRRDLQLYFPIAQGRATPVFDQYIDEARKFDFKPLVCEEFYCFLTQGDPRDPKIYPLLNGIFHRQGAYTLKVEGVKAILAQFTYARYVLKSNIVDTSFGFVQKMDESSVPLDIKERERFYHHYRNQGFELFKRFAEYMNRSKDYPAWKACNTGCHASERKINYRSTLIQ